MGGVEKGRDGFRHDEFMLLMGQVSGCLNDRLGSQRKDQIRESVE